MKHLLALLALLISCDVLSGEGVPQVKPEEMPVFVSIGAVTTFEHLCLLTYADRKKFAKWQLENEASRLGKSNEYQQDPTDETYRIDSPLVSFVMNASKKNACTILAVGTNREAVEEHIEMMLRAYTQQGKGGKLKIEDQSRQGKHSKHYAVLSPDDVSYIEVFYSDSIAQDGIHETAITGATRRRDAK